MPNPIPYRTPIRATSVYRSRRREVKWRGVRGGRVYAPVAGVLSVTRWGRVVVTTDRGHSHRLAGVRPRKRLIGRRVKRGRWIGNAKARTVRYRVVNPRGKPRDALRVTRRGKLWRNPPMWLPGAPRLHAYRAGDWPDMSSEGGDEVKVIWHTTESGRDSQAIWGVARYITREHKSYHVLWNPWTGQFIALYPADVPARSAANGGGMATNRHGRLAVQVSIVGRAADKPLAGGSPLKGRRRLMQWFDQLGIPRTQNAVRSVAAFKMSGHTTHAATPGNWHNRTDPGPVDWDRLLAP